MDLKPRDSGELKGTVSLPSQQKLKIQKGLSTHDLRTNLSTNGVNIHEIHAHKFLENFMSAPTLSGWAGRQSEIVEVPRHDLSLGRKQADKPTPLKLCATMSMKRRA